MRPIKPLAVGTYVAFGLAVALALVVSGGDIGGVLIFGSGKNIKDVFFIYYPLLAFPLSITPFLFPRIGTAVFTIYVLVNWLFSLVVSLPVLSLNPFDSWANIMLVCAALLFWMGLFLAHFSRPSTLQTHRSLE